MNRPIMTPSLFLLEFRALTSEKKFKESAIALSLAMASSGATEALTEQFQTLNNKIQTCLLAVARRW